MEVHDNEYKIVDFKTYCDKCKHKNLKENKRPCGECLDNSVNLHTRKPVKFEEK